MLLSAVLRVCSLRDNSKRRQSKGNILIFDDGNRENWRQVYRLLFFRANELGIKKKGETFVN
jgi:hypothetical protein